MYSQGPTIGTINPSFSDFPDEKNPSQPRMDPPPYPGMSIYPQGPVHTGVTVQPTVYMTSTPALVNLPDYFGYSIFTLLCCCFPLGIAAVIYSISSNLATARAIAPSSSPFIIMGGTLGGGELTRFNVLCPSRRSAVACFGSQAKGHRDLERERAIGTHRLSFLSQIDMQAPQSLLK
ncbi:unnamed protein product [Leuciscus chuanchicus]